MVEIKAQHYKDIGLYLKDCREGLGYDIKDISEQLKIRQKYLQAIEDGNLEILPGTIYTEGYLKNYAEYLELDPKDVLRRYKNGGANDDMEQENDFTPHPSDNMRPNGRSLGLAALAIVVVYFGWYYLSGYESGKTQQAEIKIGEPLSEEEIAVMGVRSGRVGVNDIENVEILSGMDTDSEYEYPGVSEPKPPEDLTVLEKLNEPAKSNVAKPATAEIEDGGIEILGWKINPSAGSTKEENKTADE